MTSETETFLNQDHEAYRSTVRQYLQREVVPYYDDWERERLVDRAAWRSAGRNGILGLAVPEAFGGAGEADYRYRVVVAEEIAAAGVTSFGMGITVQDDLVLPYLLDLADDDQKARWLPGMASGDLVGAIALTEPGAGSDLQSIRTTGRPRGGGWTLDGQKTFISNGVQADLVVVLARTADAGSRSFSLFVVERGAEGFERGRKLDKVGLAAQDTAELFFQDVSLPPENLLGEAGSGFAYLMQRLAKERLAIAVGALTAAEASLAGTLTFVFDRSAFGQRVGDFQHSRFVLAEMETELDVTRAYLEGLVRKLNAGILTAVDASKAKWWATELQQRVVTRCVQLHGGYGFVTEYPIARAFRDARVQTLYGGTTEIMKEIIGRDIASRHT